MNTQEFENQYKQSISRILNDLQSMALISSQLESMVIDVGISVQRLSEMVDEFVRSQDEAP